MNLTWHIVKKDLRRMAWPVSGWLAFVAAALVWLGAMHMPEDSVRAGDFYNWINGLGGLKTWAVIMQVVTAALLAAHLMLEDATVGTMGFWLTRPIARGRMLAAKLMAGGLLLVVAPVIALTPVWLANGFSLGETAMAAGEFAAWQIALVVLAFAVASLTKNLAQFFFAATGMAVAFAMVVSIASLAWQLPFQDSDLLRSRQMLTLFAPVPFMLAVLGWQVFTRRTKAGWIAVGVGLLALLAVGVAWPWDVTANWPRARARMRATAVGLDDLAARIAVKKIVTPFDRALPQAVFVTVKGGPIGEGFFAPESDSITLRLADKRRIQLTLSPGGLWGEDAAMRIAGLKRDADPVEWGMAGRVYGVHDWSAMREALQVSGMLQFAFMHGRVVAELPLQPGAQARSGSSTIRIVGLGGSEGLSETCVVVEERDSVFIGDVGQNEGRMVRQNDHSRRDCYFLVNRALGVAKCLHIVESGSANMASLLVSVRQLYFSFPERVVNGKREELAGWREGAVLIKVRFELDSRTFSRLTTERVPLELEEEKK